MPYEMTHQASSSDPCWVSFLDRFAVIFFFTNSDDVGLGGMLKIIMKL